MIAFHLQVKISLKNHESYNFGKSGRFHYVAGESEKGGAGV